MQDLWINGGDAHDVADFFFVPTPASGSCVEIKILVTGASPRSNKMRVDATTSPPHSVPSLDAFATQEFLADTGRMPLEDIFPRIDAHSFHGSSSDIFRKAESVGSIAVNSEAVSKSENFVTVSFFKK